MTQRGLLSALLLTGLMYTATAFAAPRILVTDFGGKPRDAAEQAQRAIGAACGKHGLELVPLDRFREAAKRHNLKESQALKPDGLAKLAGDLAVAGVVLGELAGKGKRLKLVVRLLGANGSPLVKRELSLAKGKLSAERAEAFAKDCRAQLKQAGTDRVATAPAPASSQPGTASAPASSQPGTASAPAPTTTTTEPAPAPASTVSPAASADEIGFVHTTPNLQLVVGLSELFRSGLVPRHAVLAVPSVALQARGFVALVHEQPWVEEIGLDVSFQRSVALRYKTSSGAESYPGSYTRWQVGLLYRLSLAHLLGSEVPLAPELIVDFAFGGTTMPIDTTVPIFLDASYTYPAAGLELDLEPLPELRLALRFDYLFTALTGDDVDAYSGSGFACGAEGALALLQLLEVADEGVLSGVLVTLRYDLLRLSLTRPAVETSDTFHTLVLGVGWAL